VTLVLDGNLGCVVHQSNPMNPLEEWLGPLEKVLYSFSELWRKLEEQSLINTQSNHISIEGSQFLLIE
jgi:hypothetical protein